MKKISLFVILGIVLLSLSGCFQSHRIIHLNKDGSGRIVETILLSGSMDGFMGSDITYHDEEKLREDASKYGEDVKYVSSQEVTKNTLKGYEVTYSFPDISKIKLPKDATEEMMNTGMMSDSDDVITFKFKKGGTSELTVIFPSVEADTEEMTNEEWEDEEFEAETSDEDQDDAMQMAKALYADMEISLKIIVDGKISSTNAEYSENNEVILEEIIFAKIMEDEKSAELMNKMDSLGDEELQKTLKNFPGVKMEMKEEISIKFK